MYSLILKFSKLPCRTISQLGRNSSTGPKLAQRTGRRRRPREIRDPNPGIQKQLEILKPEERVVQEAEYIDDYETDFMNVGKFYDVHEEEKRERQRMIQHKIVEHKYFRQERNVNLLTWAEKEQIRHLHNSNPEEWTVEKLSRSFPATEEIVKKVLKTNWRPADASRIVKHDQAVERNWKLLTSGELEIDPRVKDHMLQFTERRLPSPPIPHVFEEKWRPKPKRNEFGSIIESYKQLTAQEAEQTPETFQKFEDDTTRPTGDSVLVSGGEAFAQQYRMTLEKYRDHVQSAVDRGRDPSVDTALMLKGREQQHSVATTYEEVEVTRASDKPKEGKVEVEDDHIPWRIAVPRDKWGRGVTFKLGDCYYDNDGTFLYRVPGIK